MEMNREPNSAIYPRSQAAIDSIAANMKGHGFDLDFPIIVKDGEIVDGWHRYQAALQVGVEPVFKEFDGDGIDSLLYILRANGDRQTPGYRGEGFRRPPHQPQAGTARHGR